MTEFDVKEVFFATVNLQFMDDCPVCEFGHGGNTKKNTDEFDSYSAAMDAGIEMAKRHGGGDVVINKHTSVEKKEKEYYHKFSELH